MQNKLSLEEINNLGNTYHLIKHSSTKSDLIRFENDMIGKLDYIINQKLAPYRPYKNYNDLKGEAWLAFSMCLNSFDPERGNFAKWIHRYVDTAISRKALKHSIVKIPLRKNKREDLKISYFGLIKSACKYFKNDVEEIDAELFIKIKSCINSLNEEEKNIIVWRFGLDNEKPKPISKIAKNLTQKPADIKIKLQNCLDKIKEELDEKRISSM
jgi:RNA polymerase sigma factor (sigma-70 family)